VFLFGTRLTRVSRELRRSTVPALGERLPPDAGGGTRLGEALDAFATGLGRRGLAHGATLVVYSDGLDLGEAERVEAALARLRRLARRILWVNPLLGTAGYAPKARAMAAALPYLDRFLPGNTVASLLALAPVLFGEGNG
jgi:uncharacterized protein with von Willebrand factor type A (vWA) domain